MQYNNASVAWLHDGIYTSAEVEHECIRAIFGQIIADVGMPTLQLKVSRVPAPSGTDDPHEKGVYDGLCVDLHHPLGKLDKRMLKA